MVAFTEDDERPVGAVAEEHVPVQVVALDERRPLEADQRGKRPGIVEALGGVDDFFPDRVHFWTSSKSWSVADYRHDESATVHF